MYYKIENYVDENGKTIIGKIPMSDNKTDTLLAIPKEIFFGMMHITARTPQGVMQIPFEFEFPEDMSLGECFTKFGEIAQAKFEEFKKEQDEKNRIIPASSMPAAPSNLIQFPQ